MWLWLVFEKFFKENVDRYFNLVVLVSMMVIEVVIFFFKIKGFFSYYLIVLVVEYVGVVKLYFYENSLLFLFYNSWESGRNIRIFFVFVFLLFGIVFVDLNL